MEEATVITWLDTDYYEVLGLPRDATQADIARAYRRQARAHHPDTTSGPGDTASFIRVQEAYEVLGRQQTREQYDEVHRVAEHYRILAARRAAAVRQRAADVEADAWVQPYAGRLRIQVQFTFPLATQVHTWRAYLAWNPWLGVRRR